MTTRLESWMEGANNTLRTYTTPAGGQGEGERAPFC
jgi:hypothetical protein